jgi:peptide/nickel transport system substrate-binding protein
MRYLLFLYIIFLTLTGSGCGGAAPKKDPYTLYSHLTAEPGTLNPITSTDAYASSINGRIYESLVERDKDNLEIIPELAERWTISPDKLKYRFYLKKGVLWSDGVEFTADDIIYSFKVMKDPKTASAHLKVYYIDVKDVKKLDKYTVEFTYSKPYFLALEFCGGMPIVPKHIFDDGTDFNSHKNNRFPVGTGPYKFHRWDTGKRIVLKVNERYRGKTPEIKTVVYKLVAEANVALQMLKKGDLDMMPLRGIQWVRQTNSAKFQKNFYKKKYYQPYYSYIGWNARRNYFKSKIVRRALTHMINRQAILDKLMFGLGEIVTGNFYIFSKEYNKKIRKWAYDPELGRKLLAREGWKDSDGDGILDKKGKKFSFTFTISSGSKFAERLASILKEDFSKAGIEMEIHRFEWAVFVSKLNKRDFDAVTLGWSLGYGGDPYQLWHSSQVEKGSNFCSFVNREADSIIERARVEFDRNRRIRLYHRFHEILHEEQPYTFMFAQPVLYAVSRRFENVKVHTMGLDFEEWTVKVSK